MRLLVPRDTAVTKSCSRFSFHYKLPLPSRLWVHLPLSCAQHFLPLASYSPPHPPAPQCPHAPPAPTSKSAPSGRGSLWYLFSFLTRFFFLLFLLPIPPSSTSPSSSQLPALPARVWEQLCWSESQIQLKRHKLLPDLCKAVGCPHCERSPMNSVTKGTTCTSVCSPDVIYICIFALLTLYCTDDNLGYMKKKKYKTLTTPKFPIWEVENFDTKVETSRINLTQKGEFLWIKLKFCSKCHHAVRTKSKAVCASLVYFQLWVISYHSVSLFASFHFKVSHPLVALILFCCSLTKSCTFSCYKSATISEMTTKQVKNKTKRAGL